MSNLLVPIYLDALVLTTNSPTLKKMALDYDALCDYDENKALGGFLEPDVRRLDPVPGNPGVHLHWTLPEAFRHGVYDAKKEDLHFPMIPNRWLIHRISDQGDTQAWVLESDSEAPSAEVNRMELDAATKQLTLKAIGKCSPLSDWEEPHPQNLFLTIMAEGNPEFAACYSHSKNVMGFHDPLTDVTTPQVLSYQVCGWYSNEDSDILAGVSDEAGFFRRLEELNWTIDKTSLTTIPKTTCCHSSVHSVQWGGKDGKANAAIPSISDLQVAIGQSSSDALAALLKTKIAADSLGLPQQLLAALQYKKMEENGLQEDGRLLLRQHMKDRGFYPVEGGSTWILEPGERKSENTKDIEKAPLPDEISNNLTKLLAKQSEFDLAYQLLIGCQETLYGLGYKQMLSDTSDYDISADVKNRMVKEADDLKRMIGDKRQQLKALKEVKPNAPEDSPFEEAYEGEIPNLVKDIKAQLAKYEDFKNYELKETKAPVFFRANDPTIVIDGLKPDERYLEKNAIKCRLASEVLQYMRVTVDGVPYDVSGDDLDINFQLSGSKSPIPPEIETLVKESLLWNTSMASCVAKCVVEKSGTTQTPKDLENHIKESMQKHKAADYEGTLPECCAAKAWEQPWNPLYLEWGVQFQPNSGEGGEGRFMYGRTLLSNSLVDRVSNLNDRLEKPLFQTVRPMFQTLSGLSDQLIGRYHGIQLPLVDENLMPTDVDAYIGNAYAWQPQPDENTFYPLREGAVTLTLLRVIDTFGQVLKIKDPAASINLKEIATSSALEASKDRPFSWVLPRRLPQSARLNFEWLSAKEPERLFNSDIGTSPIHGWLLLDKLDQSIEVYDASGKDLGALMNTPVRFVPSIDNPSGTIEDPSLDAFIQSIVKAQDPSRFDVLYNEMDKLQQKIAGSASRQSFVMGLPFGFPLALASATCTLEMAGLPAQPLDWDQTTPYNWAETYFQVQIGDYKSALDGLLCYCVDKNFEDLSFVAAAGKNASQGVQLAVNKGKNLTVLLDPRAGIQIRPDVLPGYYHQLPADVLKKPLQQMQVGFLAAPIITPTAQVQVPLMNAQGLSWQWVTKSEDAYTPPAVTTPESPNLSKLTFEAVQAVEGWLRPTTSKKE